MEIQTFTYKGQDIEMTLNNGWLAYSFLYEGQTYGAKVKLPSRKSKDIVACTANLIINAIETYQVVCEPKTSSVSSKK